MKICCNFAPDKNNLVMEHLDVFDCSNVFIGSYFTDDRDCAHCNRDHTLIYIYSGELEITENGRKTILRKGDCAFLRRDNRLWMHKRVTDGEPYRSIVLKFSRKFLREFYQTLTGAISLPMRVATRQALSNFPPTGSMFAVCLSRSFPTSMPE